ncbi:MAG: hypothetical protein JRE23_08725 [Deltaproteobacteria bacterium]|nr:hypothetical protein [Deltaproteobacteria bacterium]
MGKKNNDRRRHSMEKSHRHDELSNVECANNKCARVNGREGVARVFIKQNVVKRAGENHGPLYCYSCAMWRKTGMTRAEAKRAKGLRVKNKDELVRAEKLKAMTAGNKYK